MLETSPALQQSLEQVRAVQNGTPQERPNDDPNKWEVQKLIDTEWVMLVHNLPTFRVWDETDKEYSGPHFCSTWATIEDRFSEDGSYLQVQIRSNSVGLASSIDIYTRLVDCRQREIASEAERSMIIARAPASINIKDESAESGYRSIEPENEEDWQKMLSTLEQIKAAEFDEILIDSHNPLALEKARQAQAAA